MSPSEADPKAAGISFSNKKALKKIFLRGATFGIAWVYFTYWDKKTKVTRLLKDTSLGIISSLALVWAFELAGHLMGIKRSDDLFSLARSHVYVVGGVKVLFFSSVVFAITHHYAEMKRPIYEADFVQRLCDFLERRRTENVEVIDCLELLNEIFAHSRILHASIALPIQGSLLTSNAHIWPSADDENFFLPRAFGHSVDGQCFLDGKARYVPRLFFPFDKRVSKLPTMRFPHAISYMLERAASDKAWRLVCQEPDLDRVTGDSFSFSSFISIPLKVKAQDNPVGVLNLDFAKVDPMRKADIAMAVAFASLVAEEVVRENVVTLDSTTPADGI